MKLSEMKKSAAKHVLVFGPPKSGKSLLVGKLAEAGYNLKWFDLENGRTVLYQLSPVAQQNIDIFVIPDTKEYPVAAETIPIVLKGEKVKICNEHGKVACSICLRTNPALLEEIHLNALTDKQIFVLDSTTQWSNSIMSHIGRKFDDTWKPEWDHYRTQGAMLDRVLTNVQNAPYHCIFITHETGVKMEDGKEKLVPIAGTTNFSRNTAKYFDEVIYCEIKNKKHVVGSSSIYANNILTGSRSGVVIEGETEASLLKIFQSTESKVDPAQAMLLNMKREIGK